MSAVPPEMSRLFDEVRVLERQRQDNTLSLDGNAQLEALREKLSRMLADRAWEGGERRDTLRVPCLLTVYLTWRDEARIDYALDFGGGGMHIVVEPGWRIGEEVLIDGVSINQVPYPLQVRAEVAWTSEMGVGLKFAVEEERTRTQIDRVFFRLLDEYVNSGHKSFSDGGKQGD